MKLNLDLTLQQVWEYPQARAVFEKYIPHVLEKMAAEPKTQHLSIKQIIKYSQGRYTQEMAEGIERELRQLGDAVITDGERKKMERYQALNRQPAPPVEEPRQRNAFEPGKVWTDTEGKRIHAHGGAILEENGWFYWYGENKEHTTGTDDIWTWGIRAYRSKDLYNWEDLGLIIPPVLDDPDSVLFPDSRMDRPHILHCRKTGKYVCWIHLAGKASGFLIMQADQLTGPYEMVRECYRPGGRDAGDFDLVQDENCDAYLYVDLDHRTVSGRKLAEDYLSADQEISLQYDNLKPPFCREGIAVFAHAGKKFMLSSGMTGYIPNRSDAAVSNAWEEPFVSLGDPYPTDFTHSSFNSQFTDVFRVPGKKKTYIALSDRWVPGFPVTAEIADIMERAVAKVYDPEHYSVTPEEQAFFNAAPNLHTANTSLADYVWLPVDMSGDRPEIRWLDQWTLDDFE